MCETAAVTLCCLKLIYYFAGSDFETLSVSHLLWRNVSTQFFTASFQFIEMCSIHSCTALSWCHHSTTNSLPSYMTQTGPRFCCWTDGLTSDSRLFWYTEDFMVKLVTTRCQIPVCAKKKSPKNQPSSTLLTVGTKRKWWMFFPDLVLCIVAIHIVEVLWFV